MLSGLLYSKKQPPEVFCVKTCSKKFHKIQKKTPVPGVSFLTKETLAQVFSYEFCEISKNTFSTEHLWTAASVQIELVLVKTNKVGLI